MWATIHAQSPQVGTHVAAHVKQSGATLDARNDVAIVWEAGYVWREEGSKTGAWVSFYRPCFVALKGSALLLRGKRRERLTIV